MKGNIFIKRPVMAFSISILILIVGFISLGTLPVEQYPDIAPPDSTSISLLYGCQCRCRDEKRHPTVGRSHQRCGKHDLHGIDRHQLRLGRYLHIFLNKGTDPDMAAVNVQNRVSKAQGLLPAEVTRIGVTTTKRQTSFLQIGALYSPSGRYDKTFIANYLDINVVPQIKRIEGVGDVMALGDTYSMRIWLKPDVMAQYGLVPSDVTAVLGEQNLEALPARWVKIPKTHSSSP